MLKAGSTGEEVAALQAFLKIQGYDPGTADGKWGNRTDIAFRTWQAANDLQADGLFGPASYQKAWNQGFRIQTGKFRFVPAAHFTPAERGEDDINLVTLHATDGGEKHFQADATAAWLANKASGGSAHYIRDPDQTIQCVREKDKAWGAAGVNDRAIHVEHCGRGDQTAEQWDDENSRAILAGGAALVADICKRYRIPVVLLDEAALARGEAGIVMHSTVTKWHPKGNGGHYDPGPGFPVVRYLEMVRTELAKLG